MPKTFPIMIEVEEIALGPVLRKLNEMPGIAKLHLDLGHGGVGGMPAAPPKRMARTNGDGSSDQKTVALLMKGPQGYDAIAAAIGSKKQNAYAVVSRLKLKGLVEPGEAGTFRLTANALAKLQGADQPAALPAPMRKTASGRAPQGSAPLLLRAALDAGPLAGPTLKQTLAAQGMSAKSFSGIIDRARQAGIVKRNGDGLLELTAKGQKLPLPGVAHG
jgi:hypothetical protein